MKTDKRNIDRIDFIKEIGSEFPQGRGVEVGTFKGEFSKRILEAWGGKLYMVDVWRPLGEEYVDHSNHGNFENGVYGEAMRNTSGVEDRGIMIRATSEIASDLFQDNSLDFVYIDANHAYDYVKQDIELWYRKVKRGGYLCGHDYLALDWTEPPFAENGKDKHIYLTAPTGESSYGGVFGVNPAVDEFCKDYGYDLGITQEWLGTWFVKKEPKASIYLDDFRIPLEHPKGNDWIVVKNFNEFVSKVTEIGLLNIDIISLDHDLDESSTDHYYSHVKSNYEIDYSKIKEKTGMDVVRWLVNHAEKNSLNLPQCYVHSANPIGAGNMMGYINLYLKKTRNPENCTRVRWKYKK
jgi:hypothetical protein